MRSYIFDIETDGLLPDLTRIHCLVLEREEDGAVFSFGPDKIHVGAAMLAEADRVIGHNIIKFDLPALRKVFPGWTTAAQVRDTLVTSRLIWPADVLKVQDLKLTRMQRFPSQLIGRHSLEAWGYRVGNYKGDYKGPWAAWSPEMEAYCLQDVEVTATLWRKICDAKYSERAIQLEHDVQEIIFQQEQEGVPFSEEKGRRLYAELVQKRADLEVELQKVFPPWELRIPFTPKANNRKRGYVKGLATEKVKTVTFNPGSRDHIADRLMSIHGWKPAQYGNDGKPTVDENVLKHLPYPEIPLLLKYLLVQKRIGQLAEGKKALLKFVRQGRIHGELVTNGAVTGRATHKNPNLSQVPHVQKDKSGVKKGEAGEWGWEFRDCFEAPPGWVMVGCDVSGLELRMLSHYMARWDGGAYGRIVLDGDIHTANMNAAGLSVRDQAKTFIYAFLYGAGDGKLGKIVGKGKQHGAILRAKFMKGVPALGHLVTAVKHKHKTQGYLLGLDGRHLHTRSDHSALNTLLQSAGALVCKLWLVILHRKLRERGFVWGKDYAQVLWVHDEVQLLARESNADEIGKIAVEAVREAGEEFGLRITLDGEYKVGRTWAETH